MASGAAVPALSLACFTGGGQQRLADLGAPAVVNLWASWCGPCRDELPAVEGFAGRAAGRVRVVGVVTGDRHDAAQSFIDDEKLTFPMLEDPQQKLLAAVARRSLPVTLLVTAGGRIAYLYNSTALDEPKLAALVERYLGVAVPA